MSLTAVENAIHAWVVAGSGLAATQVWWAQQSARRKAPPYVVINVLDEETMGEDTLRVADNPGGDPGEEISYIAEGWHRSTLQIQVYGTTPLGTSSPKAIARAIKQSARLPTVRDALVAGGVGLGVFGQISSVPAIVGATTEPRAVMTVPAFTADSVTELGTNVLTAEGTGTGDLAGTSFDTGA